MMKKKDREIVDVMFWCFWVGDKKWNLCIYRGLYLIRRIDRIVYDKWKEGKLYDNWRYDEWG